MIVGITAGIGAGKSIVSRVLRSKGFPVYDCDYEARIIMDDSPELKEEIACNLGAHCVVDSNLDRKAIAECVFADENKRLWLNSKVHGMVLSDFLQKVESSHHKLWFVESAILKSSGLADVCDMIWIVRSDSNLRLKRAADRDGCDMETVAKRMKAQENEYDDFGDVPVVIIKNDAENMLLPQINEILTQII